MFSGYQTPLFIISFIMNMIFAIVVVFVERRNPAVTWAWLMVIALIPYFGFILYLLLGMDSRKTHVFIIKARSDDKIHKEFQEAYGNGSPSKQKNVLNIPESEHFDDMVYLNAFSGRSYYTSNNNIIIYNDGASKFDALINDIRSAKHFIHLQYYIVRNDGLGKRLVDELAAKAKEGVDVRFLVDGMGCILTSKKLFRPLINAGGKFIEFMPPHFVRINFRNHRKICVIDGKTGYIGGLNIGDEYIGKVKKFGNWRDTHIRITGGAVRQLELRFLMDWNFCSLDRIGLKDGFFSEAEKSEKTGTGVGMQIVSSGPDTARCNILYSYVKMINEADKNVYIQTPYFVPDDSMFEALRIAALSGIDVRIMIPANPDHPFVYWAALSYLGDLMEVGVRCYKYEKGFVHSKTIMIDSTISSVGTANMDLRSFKLNFECNAFIYDTAVTKELEDQFLKDIDDCTEIDLNWYLKRGYITRIKESVSRLLSPLL